MNITHSAGKCYRLSMRFLWFFAFLILLSSGQVQAQQCKSLFERHAHRISSYPLDQIYAGQTAVGYQYATYKALKNAGFDPNLDSSKWSSKKVKKIVKSLLSELESSVPVVIDPVGRVFALDQHHDIFALSQFSPADLQKEMPIRVMRDYSLEDVSTDEFKQSMVENGWVYAKNVDDVVDQPRVISVLDNSNERSVVGIAFVQLSEDKKIPLKGKYFVPFIQFLLADFIKSQKQFIFKEQFSNKDVQSVMRFVTEDAEVRTFLREHLKEKPPAGLLNFLKPD